MLQKGERMAASQSWPRFRYEAELDTHFPEEVASMPGGHALYNCIQCGTCSGTCPLATYMDYSPRKIIAMTRAGFKEEVLGSFTIWLCASCYACAVECPRQIKITDFMAELKQRAIHGNRPPKRLPAVVLAKEFYRMVQKRGRNSEGRLILRLYAKTNPLHVLRLAGLGWRLLWSGRFHLRADGIRHRRQLQRMLRAVDAPAEVSA